MGEKQLQGMGGRYSQLEMKFTTITQELSQSKDTIRSLNVTINELKTNLQREIQIKVDIQRKYEEISMQFTKIKEEYSRSQQIMSELRYNIEELTKEVGHKDSTIRELMVKIQTYEKQIESFKMTIQQLRGDYERMMKEKTQLQDEIVRLQGEMQAFEDRMHKVTLRSEKLQK